MERGGGNEMDNSGANAGRVLSLNVSEEKGTIKNPVDSAIVNMHGIKDDAHAGNWHRQVSLLASEKVREFEKELGQPIKPGEFGENITTVGVPLEKVAVLDKIQVGDVLFEVTQIGKYCHGDGCAIFQAVKKCVMPSDGIFCRVLEGGDLTNGDAVTWQPKVRKFRVVTLSDRAARGEYKDLSGPRIRALLGDHFTNSRWQLEISSTILPDDVQLLRQELVRCREEGIDFVITTGGTGIGPRDITVDVVEDLAERTVPGIMEHIRVTCGSRNPNALLSRGVVGILGGTVVYTLPGSVKAVNEYMSEITKTLEHLFKMLHGIGH
jgi:molybdopterin adenylyltransferase